MMIIMLGVAQGCAGLPLFPNVPVYVGKDKTLWQYQMDSDICQQFAVRRLGTSDAQWAIRRAGLTGLAAVLVGVGIGALLGQVAGGRPVISLLSAGIGAAGGGVVGFGQGKRMADLMQQRFDTAYGVCMDHAGHRLSRGRD